MPSMDASPRIRPLARADYEAWKPLWDGYNAFYGRSGPGALPHEVTETTWRRFFDGYEPVHALVAERGDRLPGLAHYLFHRSTIQLGPNRYLQDLFTAPEARGHGVGHALIEEVYRRAEQAGAGRVYWQAHETNATAMRPYGRDDDVVIPANPKAVIDDLSSSSSRRRPGSNSDHARSSHTVTGFRPAPG
jgi:GNAT superfamily N-acetyltransferase